MWLLHAKSRLDALHAGAYYRPEKSVPPRKRHAFSWPSALSAFFQSSARSCVADTFDHCSGGLGNPVAGSVRSQTAKA